MHNNSGKLSSGPQKNKESLKSKLDGNELDLSLSNLDVVPVKELATIPKATILDLSCNQLYSLGDDFPILTHLVKLDLSKNRLVTLPDDFGSLVKLQHLDLYKNSITMLPVTFGRLASLKWLDVRDNPLDTTLALQAGDCINDAQCRQCAKSVVEFMKKVEEEAERVRQKRLKEENTKERKRKAVEERERQKAQQQKKAEKEKRKQEQARLRAAAASENPADDLENDENVNTADDSTDESETQTKAFKQRKSKKGGLMKWCLEAVFMLILFLAGVVITIVLYCRMNPDSEECKIVYNDYWPLVVDTARRSLENVQQFSLVAYNRTIELIGQRK